MRLFIFSLFMLYFPISILGQNGNNHQMMYEDSSRLGSPYAKDPYVLKFGEKYLMYYSIPSSTDKDVAWGIGIAQSDNLNNWKKIGEINPLANSSLEKKGICAPCAMVRNDTIHLFYQSYGSGASDAICHAYSLDGIHFERNATNPVFRPTGDWNCGRAIDAEVFKYNEKYFLYFATRDKEYKKQILGVAVTSLGSSFDCGTWAQVCSKSILSPELPWEGNCIEAASVILRNGKLYMFYAGNYNNSPQQIGVAESQDGLIWKRCSEDPFLAAGKQGEWNSSESGHPGIFDGGKLCYLFYQGNDTNGKTWFISNVEVQWDEKGPILVQ